MVEKAREEQNQQDEIERRIQAEHGSRGECVSGSIGSARAEDSVASGAGHELNARAEWIDGARLCASQS